MKSSDKLYKPRNLTSPINTNTDDTSEWTTVENSKIKKPEVRNKLQEKKRRNLEYRLNKTINDFLDSVEENNKKIFVMTLLEKNIQAKDDSRLKTDLNKILYDLEKNYEAIKTSRSFGYFNKIKGYVDNNISKLNYLVNKDNLYILIGNNLLTDKEGVLLSSKAEYESEMIKFSMELKSKELALKKEPETVKSEKPKRHVFASNSAKVKSNKSFASLFK